MMDIWTSLSIGIIPSASMAAASLVLICFPFIETSKQLEAASQYLCAGLILAAVAVELFPILMDESTTLSLGFRLYCFSIVSGFGTAIFFLYGMASFIDFISDETSEADAMKTFESEDTRRKLSKHFEMSPIQTNQPYQSLSGSESPVTADYVDWEEDGVVAATNAIAHAPGHRERICEIAQEISNKIKSLDQKVTQIFSSDGRPNHIVAAFREELTEDIDKEVHLLQYKIDYCRRLLEGVGAVTSDNATSMASESWLNDRNKQHIYRNLNKLKVLSANVLDEFDNNHNISPHTIQDIHSYIQMMDSVLLKFHDKVSTATYRWKKRSVSTGPIPTMGSTIPISLVLPVLIDAMVDGFLIGLSAAISFRVGYILAAANALEMGFLGIAMSIRIRKCTGSHILLRYMALLSPPLVMLIFTLIGMLSGEVAIQHKFLYTAFVAFGIVALLSLACNELLWEARQASGGEDQWHSTSILLLGILIIIIMDKMEPS